jgi:hypothetical protein
VRFVASHLAYAWDDCSLRRMEHKHRGQDGGSNVFIGQEGATDKTGALSLEAGLDKGECVEWCEEGQGEHEKE